MNIFTFLNYDQTMMEKKSISRAQAEFHLYDIRIVVLDANPVIRRLLVSVLKTLGFRRVFEAENGYEGVTLLKQFRCELIITDWELATRELSEEVKQQCWGKYPPNNGANLVKFLRFSKHSPNPFVPVIMLTGPTDPQIIHYARDAGVNEILMKPIQADALAKRIITIIDAPRPFVTSEHYRGPCRRRKQVALAEGMEDRRKQEVRVIGIEEQRKRLRDAQ